MATPAAFGFVERDVQRIGKAVRLVERQAPQVQGPDNPDAARGVRLLLAKHEGSNGWAVNASAVVTIHNGTPGSVASAITMVAHNQFLTIPAGSACTTRWVALGHNGFGWYAVAREPTCTATCSMTVAGIDFSGLSGYVAGNIQLLGHSSGECLRWYDITTCSTAA